jgi:hypothetical protein
MEENLMDDVINYTPFSTRLLPAPVGAGFAMDDWWVWCGSVVRGTDGYVMYAARWPRDLAFLSGYQSYSEIVRARSDRPQGPYVFDGVVLGDRGPAFWDGRMTHNPVVTRWNDRYYLFYIGTTFDGAKPTREELLTGPTFYPWYRQIRIGVAVADAAEGPWQRPDTPLIEARPGMWDERVVTNPAPCVTSDGRLFLYYRSYIQGKGCRLGLAIYRDLASGPEWRSDAPLFDDEGTSFEDPFVFEVDGHFEMIAKDLTGNATGELHAAAHLISRDGIAWQPAKPSRAYSRTLAFEDGSVRKLSNMERPFLLMEDGKPSYLFAAMAEGPESEPAKFSGIQRSWNGVVPLDTRL